MLFVYLMLVTVGFVAGHIHAAAMRWTRRPRPTIMLPRAAARRTRYQRAIHSLDVRDRATWPMRERMPGEPPC